MTKVKMKLDRRNGCRVNLRLPTDLVTWSKLYASRQHKTLTDLVKEHLSNLKRQVEGGSIEQF